MKYLFRGVEGSLTEVEASNEIDARNQAMIDRWHGYRRADAIGPSGPNGKYAGKGLDLISVK